MAPPSPRTTAELGLCAVADTVAALRHLQLHGFVVLPRVLPPEQVAELRREVLHCSQRWAVESFGHRLVYFICMDNHW